MILLLALAAAQTVDLGSRRELMVDRFLVERLDGARFQLHEPRDEGPAFAFDRPWEGAFSAYVTVVRDGGRLRAYYRGRPTRGADGEKDEVTCVAESEDGRAWTKPSLGLFEVAGSRENNVVLSGRPPFSHNFSPFLDAKPGEPAERRWKALAGLAESGLAAFVSADGLRWRPLRDQPVLAKAQVPFPYMFDSQNVAFWSESEGRYVCCFRVFKDKLRRICRTTSGDFLSWSAPELMEYRGPDGRPVAPDQLYTNQTAPYFRAPHLYVATAARFMEGRQVLGADEARALGVDPLYFKDASDAVLLTTRGGAVYDRTFLESFIRPGIGARNWVSRTNYPALNVVQTGEAEMSVFVNQDYAQATAHLRRYSLRLDGFASVRAGFEGGELVTRPFTFQGKRLYLNFATSAAGSLRIAIQDPAGKPYAGFSLPDSVETIGNEIERAARWKAGADVSALAGKPVRLRVVLKDADLYAFRFGD
jgi:hypothetical protein